MAGGETKEHMTVDEIVNIVKAAGKVPVERDTFYKKLRIWN